MQKDISIEYSHIYTNSHIGNDQKLSIDILSNVIKGHERGHISLVVMVDDYSFPDSSFDYKAFTEWLREQGFQPDVVLRESQLIPYCDEILLLIKDEDLKHQILSYIETKKYPCSLFIATWYLVRLGYIKSVVFDKRFIAKRLINILPLSFKPFEDKAFEIIKSIPRLSKTTNLIKNRYFEGRLVA